MSNAQTEQRLRNAFNQYNHPQHGGVDLYDLGKIFEQVAGTNRPADVAKWTNYFRQQGRNHVTLGDLRGPFQLNEPIYSAPITQIVEQRVEPRVVREVFQPQPEVRQVTRQVEFQPESTVVEREVIVQPEIRETVREVIVPAPEVRQETVQEVYQPAPVVREIIQQAPVREVYVAPKVQQVFIPQVQVRIDTIGPPPLCDRGLLNRVAVHQHFGGHSHTFKELIDRLERIECVEQDRLQAILAKFSGMGGNRFATPEILRRMVDYCNQLRVENQRLCDKDRRNCHQNHRLVQWILEYMNYAKWAEGLRIRFDQVVTEVNSLRFKCQSLETQNDNLLARIRLLEIEISELRILIQEIQYLEMIIEQQAWEIGRLNIDSEHYLEQLRGMQVHYHDHMQRIFATQQKLSNELSRIANCPSDMSIPSFQVIGHNNRADLRSAIASLISNGASKDRTTGQRFYSRPQAQAVAKIICNLRNDVNDMSGGGGWPAYFGAGHFDRECNAHFGPDGRLSGADNINHFFKHLIDHRTGLNQPQVVRQIIVQR